MKRILITTGFILLLGIPGAARADGTGLSDAITRVMEHAQTGIVAAQSDDNGSTMLDEALPEWLKIQLMPLFLSVDTRYALVDQSKDIQRQTVCFRFDQWVMEQKMREVQDMIADAMDQQALTKMMMLDEVYRYLNKRRDALIEGGLNPEVTDAEWNEPFFWETADQNSSASGEESSGEALSYFNTDYLPINPSGYGCDSDAIGRAQGLLTGDAPGMQETLDANMQRAQKAEQFYSQWTSPEGVSAVAQAVDQLIGTSTTPAASAAPAPAPRVHKTLQGYAEKLPDDLLLWSLRGDFSLDIDDLPLLEEFRRQSQNEQIAAPDPRAFAWLRKAHPLMQLLFLDDRRDTEDFLKDRSGRTSATFAVGADPGLSIEDDFEPLRKAVLALVHVGNSMEYGLRAFVRDFGSFLWRVCPDRPGTETLRKALDAVFEDACFPYGNGKYRENPDIWQQCKAATEQ